jgi:RNA-binding protein YhbY
LFLLVLSSRLLALTYTHTHTHPLQIVKGGITEEVKAKLQRALDQCDNRNDPVYALM